jgi:putative sigma-54 modulation protein
MEIRVQSIKFDADQKLLDFIDKKLGKLSKFLDNIIRMDVTLTVEPDHKKDVKVRAIIPGDDLLIERKADTFEDAVVAASDAMQDLIIKTKGKRFDR